MPAAHAMIGLDRLVIGHQAKNKGDGRTTLIMKAISIIIGVLAVIIVLNASAGAQTPKADVATFQLGDQVIKIPAPNDFEEAASQFESIKNHFTLTEAAGNDMLAVHLPNADCEKLRAGESDLFTFYTKVSVQKDLRSVDYSAERFASLIAEVRKSGSQMFDIDSPQMKANLERLGKKVSELRKQETNVEMNQPVNLGVIDTRPNVYSVILLLNFRTDSNDGSQSFPVVGGLSFVRVKQRLIYAYTYHKYESKADVETLRDFTKQWIGQILAAN